ncbi:hypothetical protein RC96_03205 [Pectobacterium carotovorum subsp. carotovorum]|nr:hypothetical protein RC96_03205 [Pectobacterium carotovorum subsp. carotovorum]
MCIASLKCSYVNGIRSNAVPIAAFKSADGEERMKNDSFPLKSPLLSWQAKNMSGLHRGMIVMVFSFFHLTA